MTSLEYKFKKAIEKGFTCNPESGIIISPSGKVCTAKTVSGYIKLTIRPNGEKPIYMLGHQFVYFWVNKITPKIIDHINENKTDNRISNLRNTNMQVNALNRKKSKNVHFCKRSKKYIPTVMIDGKIKWNGCYNTYEEAKVVAINYKQNFIK